MINDNWDIETCTWCNGEGIDLTFKGNPSHQPPCIRCQGSGKIYVTSEMATTKKRRKYMGPVPKAIPTGASIEASESVIWHGENTGELIIPEQTKKARKNAVPKAEFIPMPTEVATIINEQLAEAIAIKPKRRGRKPGSKNQPKASSV